MAFVSWDESMSVNVHEIDVQHQKLIGMISEFYECISTDARAAFQGLLDSLEEYTRYHFATEEKYFKRFSYPDAVNHVNMHQKFTEKVSEVRKRLDQGELVVSLEVTLFLKDWLTHHIKQADKAYGSFFNMHGLS